MKCRRSKGTRGFTSDHGLRRSDLQVPAIRRVGILFGLMLFAFMAIYTSCSKGDSGGEKVAVGYKVVAPSVPVSRSSEVSVLKLAFRGSAARVEEVGKTLDYDISINPDISGTWAWDDDRTLVFTPVDHWPIGTKYSVRMPSEMFADHVVVDTKFSFEIEELKVFFSSSEFYIDPIDAAIKRVMATLQANYPIDSGSMDGLVSIVPDLKASSGKLENRPYNFTISYSDDYKEVYIVSESLGIPASDVSMKISVDAGIRSIWGGQSTKEETSRTVTVPGASQYVRVNSISHDLVLNPSQGYDQVLMLNTRGAVHPDELRANLSAWLLPLDRPELPGLKAHENHRWGNLDEMVPEVVNLARDVPLTMIPNEREYSDLNSFQFNAPADRYIYIELAEGTHFYGDYYLAETYRTIIHVKQYPKELSVVSDGSLLSLSGNRQIAILSRGVSSMRFNIGRVRPDDLNHLVSQSNGNLLNLNFRNYNFGEYNITEQYSSNRYISIGDASEPEYTSFDFSSYLSNIPSRNLRYGIFFFEVEGQGVNNQYRDRRLVMVTDLGFYVKKNSTGDFDIFVQSIATGAPVSGARVQVLGLNGNPVGSAYTGADGHVNMPDYSNLGRERKPVAYIVSRGEDMSFMPYSAVGRYQDFSSFDVGGVRGATDPEKLNAFIFSDRGIYRPGDEMRFGLVVKSGDWNRDLTNTPLECRIVDSRGSEVYTESLRLSSSGFEEVKFSTQDYWPTGNYKASIYLIRRIRGRDERIHLGSTAVKVEEFLPDNLNITANFMPLPTDGWIRGSELKGVVSVRNLFGTPATGNKVSAQITLSPGYRRFRGYTDYTFFDPFLKDNRFEEFLGEINTDDEGVAEFDVDLSSFEEASYNLKFYAEAYEKGSGRSVSYETSTFISPLEYMVGYKADGSLQYINRDSERNVEFLALNSNLEEVSVSGLSMEIREIRYVTSLVKQPNGVFKYQSVRKTYPVSSETLNIESGGTTIALGTTDPGEYEIVLIDGKDTEYSSFSYSVKGATNIERSLDRNAELELSLNKKDFDIGEEIEIFIKAPYAGAGLITIERDKVYAYEWFVSNGTSTTQRIRVPAGLEGNGYVNVSWLRALDSPEVFMSPVSYGTIPFVVSREANTNHITLDIPDEAKPGEAFPISYSTSRKGKIVIYAVDEGILQVAGYHTPDPLDFFFRKRALEVSTAQITDLLLPEFSIVQSLAAIGGGGPGDYLDRNLNPFRRRQEEPVAYWSGVIDAGPGGGVVEYQVPSHFNGTLRVMAVAVSQDAVGSAEESAIIRDTFVIKPNNPLAAAPGDEFEVPVTVANNQKGSGDNAVVQFEVTTSDNLEVLSEKSVVLDIPEGRDIAYAFRVRALDSLGGALLNFSASANGERSKYTSSLSVRPAMPYRTTVYTGVVKKSADTVEMPRELRSELATHKISLSYLPLGLANGLYFYLERYPYGCSEQILSSTFPLLYPDLLDGLELSTAEGNNKIRETINILQARQKPDGSIGLWTSLSGSHPVIDGYTGMFLQKARKAGYYVSDSLYDKLFDRLERIAGSEGTGRYEVVNRAYAIYVLTLDERVTTPYIEKLREDLKVLEGDWESGFAGLFLAGSYAMLQQDRQANALLAKIRRQYRGDEATLYLDWLCYSSFYLTVLSEHFPQRLKDAEEELLESIAENLETDGFTTFSANFALMAVDAYLNAVPDAQSGNFSITQTLADGSEKALSVVGEDLMTGDIDPEARLFNLRNRDNLNLFYQAVRAGYDATVPTESANHNIEVFREYRNAQGKASENFKIGDQVTAAVSFRSLSSEPVSQVAIVDILPAGFEVDIKSVRDKRSGWKPDYIDIREDRIILFGTLTGQLEEFTYSLTPVARGDFSTPPVFAEAMYDQETWALSAGGTVGVE